MTQKVSHLNSIAYPFVYDRPFLNLIIKQYFVMSHSSELGRTVTKLGSL